MGTATMQGAFVGTPEYAAPEQFDGGELSAATDLFAAGCLLVECLTGTPPLSFADRTDLEACKRSWDAVLPYVVGVPGPPEVRALITAMLYPDPNKRPSIDAVQRCLGPLSRGEPPVALAPVPKPAVTRSASPEAPLPDRLMTHISFVGVGSLGLVVVLCLAVILGSVWTFGYLDGPPIVRINQPRP